MSNVDQQEHVDIGNNQTGLISKPQHRTSHLIKAKASLQKASPENVSYSHKSLRQARQILEKQVPDEDKSKQEDHWNDGDLAYWLFLTVIQLPAHSIRFVFRLPIAGGMLSCWRKYITYYLLKLKSIYFHPCIKLTVKHWPIIANNQSGLIWGGWRNGKGGERKQCNDAGSWLYCWFILSS